MNVTTTYKITSLSQLADHFEAERLVLVERAGFGIRTQRDRRALLAEAAALERVVSVIRNTVLETAA